MYERRSNRRFTVKEKVSLALRSPGFIRPRSEYLRASVEDFGRGGFQIVADRPLDPRHRLMFALQSSFLSRPLEGRGRVCYVKKAQRYGHPVYVAGVQFTAVDRRGVVSFIGRFNGWRRSSKVSGAQRRELVFFLKSLPFLVLASWLLAGALANAHEVRLRENSYMERLKEAVIYGLYHMD